MSVVERFKKAKTVSGIVSIVVSDVTFKVARISLFELQNAENKARKSLQDQGYVLADVSGFTWTYEKMAQTAAILFEHTHYWQLPGEDEQDVSKTKSDFKTLCSEMSFEERAQFGIEYSLACEADTKKKKEAFEFYKMILANSLREDLSTASDDPTSSAESVTKKSEMENTPSPDAGQSPAPILN